MLPRVGQALSGAKKKIGNLPGREEGVGVCHRASTPMFQESEQGP